MRRLICTFVVRIKYKTGFLMTRLNYRKLINFHTQFLFSSPELKAHWWAYTVVHVYVYMSTFSNISKTPGPIETKFHAEPPWEGGAKVCSNSHSHMTMMAAMPIYSKNLKISSSLEPKGLWPWNLVHVCSIGCSSTTKFVKKWWPWVDIDLFYGKVKFGPLCFCMGKRWNNGFFGNYCCLWYQSW